MKVYLVGGAVRDELLDYPVVERDWVVVGATPQDLLDLGYQQVGKDFPVFLHPQTKDEYALARKERKQGHGYTGFAVDFDSSVSLEQDLLRRDLTINAIARADDGTLIDPYGGQRDLQAKLLRHVSTAFVEDPLRVLRTARFAARYAHLGFSVAAETMELMSQIVASGELEHLPNERIWVELERSLGERDPDVFVQVLKQCGALQALLPEVEVLFGIPQPQQHHPEIDTGVHVLLAIQQAAKAQYSSEVRFAVLMHDLGKGLTPESQWPRHIGHEHSGIKLVKALCKRLAVPNQYRDLALLVCEYHTHCHRALELRGKTILKVLQNTDAFRRPDRFEEFVQACECDARGRQGLEQRDYPQADYFRQAFATAMQVKAAEFVAQGLTGKELGTAMDAKRTQLLEKGRPD